MIDESLEQRRYDKVRRQLTELLYRGVNGSDKDWAETMEKVNRLSEEERRIAASIADGDLVR